MTQKVPREWQLDIAESLHLGIDCIAVAGTGAGKTLPFAPSNMVEPNELTIIISPLDALEANQVRNSNPVLEFSIQRLRRIPEGQSIQRDGFEGSSNQWEYMGCGAAEGTMTLKSPDDRAHFSFSPSAWTTKSSR